MEAILRCINPTSSLGRKEYRGDLLEKRNGFFQAADISTATHFRVTNNKGKAVTCTINRFQA